MGHDPRLDAFFRLIFEDAEGYVCIARQRIEDNFWKEHFFQIPAQFDEIVAHITQFTEGHNVWYCPQVFSEGHRQKQFVKYCPTAWSDLDACPPQRLLVQPTVVVMSSPGRFQALWRFTTPAEPEVAEAISRKIAYFHKDDGADKSGWDLTQLLRVPYTQNHKYQQLVGGPPQVRIFNANSDSYALKEFEVYPDDVAPPLVRDIKLPATTATAAEILTEYKNRLSPVCGILFHQEPQKGRRSDDLWRLEVSLFESGLKPEEVFVVAQEAKCNKYAEDGRSLEELWREVLRAHEYYKQNSPTKPPEESFTDLLTKEERLWVERTSTIVEDYIAFGDAVTDAAPQYHQAGIFVILSALLSGSIQVRTMYGVVPLNLWFLCLADTTLTRKSTTMEMAVNMLTEISSDAVIASDGSMEGLFHALSTRGSTPSVFRRDEIAGFLEGIAKKEYQSGLLEILSNLYDGSNQKRLLRRETFSIYKPRFIFYGAGIKSRVSEILTQTHIETGFLPRFVLITAQSDPSRIRPEGPPTEASIERRDQLLNRLREIYGHYMTDQKVAVNGRVATAPKSWDATLTEEAWAFYNEAVDKMRRDAFRTNKATQLIPMFERLARSGMKAAVLIAAASRLSDSVVVLREDMVRAFYYVEEWRRFSYDVVINLAKTPFEATADRVSTIVQERPGITRREVMNLFRLKAKDMEELLVTLEQRGMIRRTGTKGKTEYLQPAFGED